MGMSRADTLIEAINYEIDKYIKDTETNLKITRWINELHDLAETRQAHIHVLRDALSEVKEYANDYNSNVSGHHVSYAKATAALELTARCCEVKP